MLIHFYECFQYALQQNKPIRGIIHVGAHEMQELQSYLHQNIYDIIWIEAQQDIVAKQKQKFPLSKIYQLAVSDRDGDVLDFHITNNGESSSLLSFGTHETEHPHVKVIDTIKVETSRLDTWIQLNQIPMENYNFMNLDIQGVELRALRGLGDYLKYFDHIYCEVNEKELYVGCAFMHEIDEYLASYGFQRVKTKILKHGWGDALYSRV